MSIDDAKNAFETAEQIGAKTLAPGAHDSVQNDQDGAFAPDYPDDWRADLEDGFADRLALGAALPLNDFGNGQRLSIYYGQDILYVPRLGWYRWKGKVWLSDEDELEVRRDAQCIAGHILDEIPSIALEPWEKDALDLWAASEDDLKLLEKMKDKTDEQKSRFDVLKEIRSTGQRVSERLQAAKTAHRAHARASGNSPKIANMLTEVKVSAATTIDALNADAHMVNCQNCVLQFVKVEDEHGAAWGSKAYVWSVNCLPHDRKYLMSKMVAAAYEPDAKCPEFLKFLEVVQPDPAVRDYLQRWFGLTLTGIKTEQKLAFFYGAGRNGKSTLTDTIARIMADYGTTIPIETLTGTEQRKGSDATPDLVRLPGARMARASEPEQGQRMKEALIKALTGGEAIMIRKMQKEFVEVVPEFKLTISGNHKPEIRGADDGIWRRVMLVLFGVQIAEADVDPDLTEKLWRERDGILAWMVAGCLDYLQDGLRVPVSVKDATAEYRKDSDPMRVFLTEECVITGSPEHFVTGRDLNDAFNAYLLSLGESAWGKRTASNAIKARASGVLKSPDGQQFAPVKRSDTGYLGIYMPSEVFDRVATFGDELRSAAGRRG